MSGAPQFTVFTPTYNRAQTIHRVYDSLRAQTLRDFEWLVVDDGSTDATPDLDHELG
jgi:Glycosyltransferases involved in cell wall biogenesis